MTNTVELTQVDVDRVNALVEELFPKLMECKIDSVNILEDVIGSALENAFVVATAISAVKGFTDGHFIRFASLIN